MKSYANAEKILPKELFKEVQKYHTGPLWIPSPSRFFQKRKDLVVALRKQGVKVQEIAGLAGVTRRRVNQILAADRKEKEFRHIHDGSGR